MIFNKNFKFLKNICLFFLDHNFFQLQENESVDLEKVKTRLGDEMKEKKENFIVPMKKRKCVLDECDMCYKNVPNIGLPTPQPSDSEGEDHDSQHGKEECQLAKVNFQNLKTLPPF